LEVSPYYLLTYKCPEVERQKIIEGKNTGGLRRFAKL
jgi:hypothetical protein